MKTIFDPSTRAELIRRIHSLDETSKAQWGTMTIYQMLKHCTLWDEMIVGGKTYKRLFLGRLFGRIALKNVLKDETPLTRNTPTIPAFRISGHGDVAAQKKEWVARINEYEQFSNPTFVHSFFGRMTREQIGYLAYKHSDHHLRQFNS